MTVRVPIEPSVLRWAAGRAGLSASDLERLFPHFAQWVSGELQPTLRQAEELAKKAHIPFGRLLLQAPAEPALSVPDFRTVRNSHLDGASSELEDVVASAEARLGWYAEYAAEEGIPAPAIVGLASSRKSPTGVASAVRESLGLPVDSFLRGQDKVKTLVDAMEAAGVLVSRNSVVGNSNGRKLDVEEFRGFTLLDEGFALVFVNTADAKTAQLFSLAHELGHVVLNKPGVSDHSEHLEIERWCNRFAAELLAPTAALRKNWGTDSPLLDELTVLSKRSGMSREAVLWRLVDLGLVSPSDAEEVLPVLRGDRRSRNKDADSAGGPPFHVVVKSRVGGRFIEAMAHAVAAEMITEREAARFVGASTQKSLNSVLQQTAYAEGMAS